MAQVVKPRIRHDPGHVTRLKPEPPNCQHPVCRSRARGGMIAEPVANVFRTDGIDAPFAERGQDVPVNIARVRTPRRGLRFGIGERCARHRDLRPVRHVPIPPVRFGCDRRIKGALPLGNTQNTPDNSEGSEIGSADVPLSNAVWVATCCYRKAFSASWIRGRVVTLYAVRRGFLTPQASRMHLVMCPKVVAGVAIGAPASGRNRSPWKPWCNRVPARPQRAGRPRPACQWPPRPGTSVREWSRGPAPDQRCGRLGVP